MEQDIVVEVREDSGEIYAVVNGKRASLLFSVKGGELIAESTYAPPELRGRGIAARLVVAMIGYAEKNGLKVYPVCSYVAEYFARRPELSGMLSERYQREGP